MRIGKTGKSGKELGRIRTLRFYHKRMEHLKNVSGGKCVVCGSTDNLEFHHIDPESKKFSISARFGMILPDLLLEVAKCELRCEVCHKRVHKIARINGYKQR